MTPLPTAGLVIGKFMPPHTGHLRLLAFARQHVSTLHVILFSKPTEPIPGSLRAGWLRELAPWAMVYHVSLDHPVDFADPTVWEFWVQAIRAELPAAPDIVFSSEVYGDELARRLEAQHRLVDPGRLEVPISALQVRARPMQNWAFIPAPVRPYFVRRIAIVGAESTGKTTLTNALAAHFETVCAPEFAREYLLARGGRCTVDDMLVIGRGQAALEETLARQANRLLVTDTDLLTTQLWHEHYFGECGPELARISEERSAHWYLLCGLDVPWVADGLRDSPERREWFHRRFIEELERRQLPYTLMSGSRAERLGQAIGLANELLNSHLESSA